MYLFYMPILYIYFTCLSANLFSYFCYFCFLILFALQVIDSLSLFIYLHFPVRLLLFSILLLLISAISFQLKRVFDISYKANLVVVNSFSFCLSEEVLISSSFVSDNLAGQRIFGCKFSPFSAQNTSCHFFWLVKFLLENLLRALCGFLCTQLFFSCCFQDSIFILNFDHFNFKVSWCVSL